MRNTRHGPGRPATAAMLSVAAMLYACGAAPPAALEAAEEPAPVVVSRWTDRSELFVEFPPLVAGATSRFAIHFTDLATFEPLREGRATVRLSGGRVEEFEVDEPGRPGIFGVDVTPAVAGRARLELLLDAAAVQDRHDLGEGQGADGGGGGGAAARGRGGGRLGPLPQGAAVVARLRDGGGPPPVDGRQPRHPGRDSAAHRGGGRGDDPGGGPARRRPAAPAGRVPSWAAATPLAQVVPRSEHADDRPALELAVAEARDALELARAAHARVERLVEVGALPERRRLEARLASQTAGARLTAAEAHLAHLDSTRRGEGEGTEDTRFVLRAPMRGVVAESAATPGASVDEGRAAVHGYRGRQGPRRRGASRGRPGAPRRPRSGRARSAGGRCSAAPRSARVGGAGGRRCHPDRPRHLRVAKPPIGGLPSARPSPSVCSGPRCPTRSPCPRAPSSTTAASRWSSSRWAARASSGARSGSGIARAGVVQVIGDVAPGDRVVTVGAPLIRLAALSPQVPAHGHTH